MVGKSCRFEGRRVVWRRELPEVGIKNPLPTGTDDFPLEPVRRGMWDEMSVWNLYAATRHEF